MTNQGWINDPRANAPNAERSLFRPDVKLDWCSYAAAKFACEHWHYAKAIPRTNLLKIGVWESGKFRGCLIFSHGANSDIGRPYGLNQWECCELVRVALDSHVVSVSRVVSIALKMLKRQSPGIRLVISYSDPENGHIGAIYQAGNWIYTGVTTPAVEHIVNGRRMHGRAVRATYGHSRFPKVMGSAKHRYLMPLDVVIRGKIEALRLPYPKRVGSDTGDTAGVQSAEGGSTPTPTLHVN